MQEFSWDFMGLLAGGSLEVIHCSRSKLLPTVIQKHGFKPIRNSSIFTTQEAMTCDFHHSLTLTKGFLTLAAKTL
jgi:hypothetical protein